MRSKLARTVKVLVFAFAMVPIFAVAAFAQTTADPSATAANSAVSTGVTTAKDMIVTNIPLLLGVTVAWIALAFGRKLVKRVTSS